jgi:hypothetical protein
MNSDYQCLSAICGCVAIFAIGIVVLLSPSYAANNETVSVSNFTSNQTIANANQTSNQTDGSANSTGNVTDGDIIGAGRRK